MRRILARMPIGICAGLLWALYAASAYPLTIGAAAPPAGAVVAAMQTASGNYITAVNGGGFCRAIRSQSMCPTVNS